LGVLFTVERLPEGVPLEVRGYVRAGGRPSAGTYHSAITAFSRMRQAGSVHKERSAAEPKPDGRRVRSIGGLGIGRAKELDAWALPMPTIDPQVVKSSATALERYGPDFAYCHYLAVHRLPAMAWIVGVVGNPFTLLQAP